MFKSFATLRMVPAVSIIAPLSSEGIFECYSDRPTFVMAA